MKVKRVVCPACYKESSRAVEEEDNLHSYREEVVYERCSNCPPNPESRLLDAIFGIKEEAR